MVDSQGRRCPTTMGSVDMVKRKSLFLGMGWQQLWNCRGPLVVVVVVLLLWSCCVSADCLQPTGNNERSSVWAITNSLQPGDNEESSARSIATDPIKPSEHDQSSPLRELPIITGPAGDLSSPEDTEGSIITGSPCNDDGIATSNVGGVPQTKETAENQVLVVCNVKCFRADPVCGEDAITYWCGAAEAKCAGVEVAYKGYCDSRSGGAGKDGTRAAQSLFLVHLTWLVLAGFLVIADLL